jgi:hypothetical protein
MIDSLFYTWSFPGAPIKVELDLDVVDRIRKEIDEIPGDDRPPSGAGLLLGEVRAGTVVISGCRKVVAATTNAFEAAIREIKLGSPGAGPVGFYRFEAGDALRLSPEDAAIAQDVFPAANSIVLLVQPRPDSLPSATFFFREGGQILGDFALLEFPFDSQLLDIERRGKQVRQSAPPPPQIEIAAQPVARRWRVRFPLRAVGWAGTVLAFGALGAGAVWLSSHSRLPSIANSPAVSSKPVTSFGLRAERSGSDFFLTWNRTSPVVTSAVWGLLSIEDGNGRRDISLHTDQLRTGSILYQPAGEEIRLRLSLVAPDQHVETESIIVIQSSAGEPAGKAGSRVREVSRGRGTGNFSQHSPETNSDSSGSGAPSERPQTQAPVDNRIPPDAPQASAPGATGRPENTAYRIDPVAYRPWLASEMVAVAPSVALGTWAGDPFKTRVAAAPQPTRSVQASDLPRLSSQSQNMLFVQRGR